MNKVFRSTIIMLLCVFGHAESGFAQKSDATYRVVNRTLSTDAKDGTIHVNEMDGAGIAWIAGQRFTDGSIEFDIKGKDKPQGSFVGIALHGVNDSTYECIYFRPFNFRATDPVKKSHAVQYISNPDNDWPKLRELYPNQYEQPVPNTLDPNEWFHVKLVVSGPSISVFVQGDAQPVLKVKSLATSPGTMIGYWVGNGSGADWRKMLIVNR